MKNQQFQYASAIRKTNDPNFNLSAVLHELVNSCIEATKKTHPSMTGFEIDNIDHNVAFPPNSAVAVISVVIIFNIGV